jgi:pilus assembly protein CpaD
MMPNSRIPGRASLYRAAVGGAALALIAALSGGCSTTGTSDADPAEFDYRMRHPIMISEEPEVLDIPVGMNGPALSPQIETAVRNYVAGYQVDGTGAVTIQVPTASANQVAATSTGQAVHYALVRAGVPHGQIVVAPYYFGNHARTASLRLSYLRVKAVTPKCGLWPEQSPNTYRNANYHNFGCAYQQNLAAMVANPADLLAPQPMSPSNGARRAKVITDYSSGKETKSETTLIESDVLGLDQ